MASGARSLSSMQHGKRKFNWRKKAGMKLRGLRYRRGKR